MLQCVLQVWRVLTMPGQTFENGTQQDVKRVGVGGQDGGEGRQRQARGRQGPRGAADLLYVTLAQEDEELSVGELPQPLRAPGGDDAFV